MKFRGEDLFDEKSLWSIYSQSLRKLKPTRFNWVTTTAVFLLLGCQSYFSPNVARPFIDQVRNLADAGLGFGATILGFLVAGFTIFATLTKPELFVKMYEKKHEASGLNYIKHNFFAFFEVFVVYLTFIGFCLAIKLFCGPGGLASTFADFFTRLSCISFDVKLWLARLGLVCLGTSFYYSLMVLKSFIYNTYHIVITSVVWLLNDPKP